MAKKPSKALTVLSQNLQRLLEARQTTQPELARRAKVDQKTVWRIVRMENEPSVDKLEKLAAVLQVETWQLLVPNLDPQHLPDLVREEVTA